jgi:hypothetical protein
MMIHAVDLGKIVLLVAWPMLSYAAAAILLTSAAKADKNGPASLNDVVNWFLFC